MEYIRKKVRLDRLWPAVCFHTCTEVRGNAYTPADCQQVSTLFWSPYHLPISRVLMFLGLLKILHIPHTSSHDSEIPKTRKGWVTTNGTPGPLQDQAWVSKTRVHRPLSSSLALGFLWKQKFPPPHTPQTLTVRRYSQRAGCQPDAMW